jgi:hypothetical protein
MPLKFEVKLGGPLSQGPAAFKESLEKKLAPRAAEQQRHRQHRPHHQHHHPNQFASATGSVGAADPMGPGGATDCDNGARVILPFAQEVVRVIPGASYDGDAGNTRTFRFRDGFYRTAYLLAKAGYYVGFPADPTGLLAYNPLQHSGGLEFRTYGNPGFHFRLVYPGWIGRILPTTTIGAGSTGDELHIDCHNPVGAGFESAFDHFVDFMNSIHLLPMDPFIPE